jgi:hypothetical protein
MWWCLTLAATTAISGCAGNALHLHSATREDQGKAAQDRWDAAYKSAQDVIKTRKERTQKLFAEDAQVRQHLASLASDAELFKFAVATRPEEATIGSALVQPIEDARKPNDAATLKDVGAALQTAQQLADDLQVQQTALRKLGGPADFSCAKWNEPAFRDQVNRHRDVLSGDEAVKRFADVLGQIDKLCPGGLDPLATLAKGLPDGTLKSELVLLVLKRQRLASMKDAQAIDRVALANALSDYRAALEGTAKAPQAAAAPASSASAASPASAASAAPASIQEAGKRVSDLLVKLHSFGDMFSLKFLSEESTKGIDDFLASLAEPKDPADPATTSRDRAALALVTLSKTGDAWEAAQREIDAVGARPLAMIQDVEALKTKRAAFAIAAEELSVDIQERKVRIRLQQALAYQLASDTAGKVSVNARAQTLQAATQAGPVSLSMPERKALLRAAGQYWYGHGYLEQRVRELQTKDRLVTELRKASEAENALAQWDALVRAQVDLLAAWSRTGVKDETVSQAINALLLIWIGLGVH